MAAVTARDRSKVAIVVDDDIDPTNIEDVLWALCTRSDPRKGECRGVEGD